MKAKDKKIIGILAIAFFESILLLNFWLELLPSATNKTLMVFIFVFLFLFFVQMKSRKST
jgi:hypothetical protein